MLLTTRRQVCSLAAALPVSAFASSVQASEANAGAEKSPKAELSVLLYPGFETIDAMGPVEMFGNLRDFSMRFASLEGRVVKSAQGLPVMTEKFEMENASPLLLVPGAAPAFLPKDPRFFEMLKSAAQKADYVLTVCTGSLLVAKTGLLNGKKATSNKKALPMVMKAVPQVDWQKKARWVVDGRFYTSSGISAGMDMALGFIADRFGEAEGDSAQLPAAAADTRALKRLSASGRSCESISGCHCTASMKRFVGSLKDSTMPSFVERALRTSPFPSVFTA